MSASTQHLDQATTGTGGASRTVTDRLRPVTAALRRLRDRMILARQRRITINELARLSDRQLQDIGIQRELIPETVDELIRRGAGHRRTAGSQRW